MRIGSVKREPPPAMVFMLPAIKPIKIVHFRPSSALDKFMYGKNRIRKPIMSKRLINIFHKHGVR